MGMKSSKTKALEERRVTEESSRQVLRTQQATTVQPAAVTVTAPPPPNVTQQDLQRPLEEQRLTEARLRRELSAQQATTVQAVGVASAPPPAQPSSAGQRNLYPDLNVNPYQPVANVPVIRTSSNFTRASPSAPILNNNEKPNGKNARTFRLPQNTDSDVQCPTCESVYGHYIYKCMNGHSACQDCKEANSKCNICETAITTRRDFALEEYISNVPKYRNERKLGKKKIPCPNETEGCCLSIKLAELDTHLRVCPFKELDCPLRAVFGNCSWKGKLSSMADHFKHEHPENCATVSNEMKLENLTSYSRKVYLVNLGKYNFLMHIEVLPNNQKINMTTQLCGTHNAASKWDYEVHVYKKNEPRKKYVYTDMCYPHSTPASEIFSSNKCVVLPSVYFMNFVNLGVLNYKFFMKKRYDNDGNSNKQESNAQQSYNGNNNVKPWNNRNSNGEYDPNSNGEYDAKPGNNRNRRYGRNTKGVSS